ncbi:uncharacterized protein LOC126369806 [Pectinophora gossypiella]|uniref:uncharacterized protein LOC126369806 n=1 Tax=Pectinophora gossypiella TaxID=13191 RepID=UPI00214DF1B2|nr:uncharacterized protein LOC126369806 [Pectinophora gossypiella]
MHELLEAKAQINKLLKLGGFELHKWSSNCSDVLLDVPSNQQQLDEIDLEKENYSIKALGLTIDAKNDCFIIKSPETINAPSSTKREILSQISKFYDPLGFVSPIVVKAKVIMQRLWLEKVDWDAKPPQDVQDEWVQFADSLSSMEPIHFNRNIQVPANAEAVQLIGFADASSSTGYGCCIYLRVIHATGKVELSLLCSKSRINPRTKPLTIPRLELNANLLLAQLMMKVYNTLTIKIKVDNVFLFTDSQVALAWINTEVTRLQAYVSNRVRVIQQLTNKWRWLYVNTRENPADYISRGLSPHEIASCSMWWHGPAFLKDREYTFNNNIQLPDDLPEMKTSSVSSSDVVLVTTQPIKANTAKQLMGSLPQQRVTASRAFQVVGLDFAGPVQVKNSREDAAAAPHPPHQ